MTTPSDTGAAAADGVRAQRGALVRWLLSYATFNVPQAAGPIAFALLALPLTGSSRSGAALVLATTLAQVACAVPVARLGRRAGAMSFLRGLVVIRTLALAALAGLAAAGAPFGFLLAAAALAGSVNGAAFGYLRSVLNHLVEPSGMPRALGLAATLSEFTFVAAPVLASVLGTIDPVLALVVLAVLGGTPALLVPASLVPDRPYAKAPGPADGDGRLLTPAISLWLGCTVANSAVVASLEIGAVALALRYGFEPAQGFVFTVALCLASVSGGVWVSARNRVPRRRTILGYLLTMSAGAVLVAADVSVAATLAGAVLVGGVLAPLSTAYSLQLDALAPARRRAEVFALSRTATSLGVILASTTLTLFSLSVAEVTAAVAVCAAAVLVGIAPVGGRAVRSR